MSNCYLVIASNGYWGKGPDIPTALTELKGKKPTEIVLWKFPGSMIDPKSVVVDPMGSVLFSYVENVGPLPTDPRSLFRVARFKCSARNHLTPIEDY